MFLLLLLPSLSIAQYDMNPGNFGVTKIYHEMRFILILLSNSNAKTNLEIMTIFDYVPTYR